MKTLAITICLLLGSLTAGAAQSESFRQTCRVRWENRNYVQADCRDQQGRYRYNEVSKLCNGDLANMNGRIVCDYRERDRDRGQRRGGNRLPAGSYAQSCHSCQARDYQLSCVCKDVQGNQRRTLLYFNRCQGDISNQNGRLFCAR